MGQSIVTNGGAAQAKLFETRQPREMGQTGIANARVTQIEDAQAGQINERQKPCVADLGFA